MPSRTPSRKRKAKAPPRYSKSGGRNVRRRLNFGRSRSVRKRTVRGFGGAQAHSQVLRGRSRKPGLVKFGEKVERALAAANETKDVYRETGSFRYTATAGKQQFCNILAMPESAVISALFAITHPLLGFTKSDVLHVTGIHIEYTLQNFSNQQLCVDLYTVRARISTSKSPRNAIDDGLLDKGNNIAITHYGASPLDSASFGQQWRIIRKERVTLEASGQKTFIAGSKKRRTWEYHHWNTANASTTYKKGDMVVFAIFHGQLCAESVVASPTLGVANLAVLVTQSYWWTHPNDIEMSSVLTDSLPTNVAAREIVEEDGDDATIINN